MMSVLRRPVLLLSAVATVTVPGVLAGLAVMGHENSVRTSVARGASFSAQAQPAAAPALPRDAHSGVATQADPLTGTESAGQSLPQAEMREGTAVKLIAAAANEARGVRLLSAAAAAGAAASYEGVEVISDKSVGGPATVVASVWHQKGVTVTQTSNTAMLANSQPYVAYDGDGHDPEGVFGVTTTLVKLLAKNYVATYAGEGSVAGRPALMVQVTRADGTVAAQFWLDKQTMLPLRRYVFDMQAQLISDDEFVQIRVGAMTPPAAAQGSAARAMESAWSAVPAPVQLVKKLNDQGWLLPAGLPGNLALYAAAQASTSSGQVVDLGFSDGLSVVSLFVQRGTLPAKLSGWTPTRISGHAAYTSGQEIALSERGFVYTLVVDAPTPVIEAAVGTLPPDTGPGVIVRIGRGLSKLARMVNPFK